MQDALSGQLNRRQEMLRAAGNFANIADYEHARSHGRALPPLPALFIVVDEYSELLSQHPAFAELFVAIWLPDLGATDKRLLRAALERFGGRADWKSRWHILAVPTATFMGSASCVFSLGDPKTRRECSVIRTTNPAHLVPSKPSPTNVPPLRVVAQYAAGIPKARGTRGGRARQRG